MTGSVDVLLYVQHLLGIGHLRRAAAIARALDRAGLSVAFVSGGFPVPGLDLGGAIVEQLPPVRSADEAFSALVDAAGRPIDQAWKAARRGRLLELYRRWRPKVLLIELFPFGRRLLRFELIPLLEAARAGTPRPQIVCSLRDIMNRPAKAEKIAWILDTVRGYFDQVLVHGDPAFVTLEHSFPQAAEIADKLVYTGYVVTEAPASGPATAEGAGEVLVSTGGGAVAEALATAALAARPLSRLAGSPWRILIGHNLPDEPYERLVCHGAEGVVVERARPDFLDLLARAAVSVSQAGYNTVLEVLRAGCPAVVVPFAAGGETEQTLRANLMAKRGLLTVVEERALTGAILARAIDRARGGTQGQGPGRDGPNIALATDGAARTAEIIGERLAKVAK
jgi:predicted glycosyltransferase